MPSVRSASGCFWAARRIDSGVTGRAQPDGRKSGLGFPLLRVVVPAAELGGLDRRRRDAERDLRAFSAVTGMGSGAGTDEFPPSPTD
jgi:hypothetical protein